MRHLFFALSLCFVSACGAQPSPQDFTNKDFAKLSEKEKNWWYDGAFSLAGTIVSVQGNTEKSHCVWNWFYADPDKRKKQLEESYKLYPESQPSSVIFALLRRDCGVFQ